MLFRCLVLIGALFFAQLTYALEAKNLIIKSNFDKKSWVVAISKESGLTFLRRLQPMNEPVADLIASLDMRKKYKCKVAAADIYKSRFLRPIFVYRISDCQEF